MKTPYKKLLVVCITLSFLVLTGCDTYPYKKNLQAEYDRGNSNGDEAICVMVASVKKNNYPYTIKYLAGEDEPFSEKTQKAVFNKRDNENLRLFAQEGFFTEELVGEDKANGKPLYRYNLTEKGMQYVGWALGATNFCFGRVVVDSIGDKKDGRNGVGGGKLRHVKVFYHLENIPDWAKNPKIYDRYNLHEDLINGKTIEGMHSYDVLSNNKLRSRGGGVSGYIKI